MPRANLQKDMFYTTATEKPECLKNNKYKYIFKNITVYSFYRRASPVAQVKNGKTWKNKDEQSCALLCQASPNQA